jgi:hypothetical protein
MGMLWQFARYKYSFYEYLYYFTREAQQTASYFGSYIGDSLEVFRAHPQTFPYVFKFGIFLPNLRQQAGNCRVFRRAKLGSKAAYLGGKRRDVIYIISLASASVLPAVTSFSLIPRGQLSGPQDLRSSHWRDRDRPATNWYRTPQRRG